MSDFDDLTGPATLSEDDTAADADLAIVDEEEAVDEVPAIDPLLEKELDPTLEEESEIDPESDELETQDAMWDMLYADKE
jgi:hypothetical protein